MKKSLPFILVLLVILLSAAYLLWPKYVSHDKQTNTIEKPAVVDFFACGDYCPGPPEQYTVKVYQDVTDETQCKDLGGTPANFQGWTKVHYCLAE